MSMSPSQSPPNAVIVGAGIAGLTAAYKLTLAGWRATVLESADYAGGRVQTLMHEGYRVDTGATALAARYPIVTELARELGLTIVNTAPYLGVYREGRIRLLRMDKLVSSGLKTDLLSWQTKLRLARVVFDVVRAKSRGMLSYDDLRLAAPLDTETASSYIRRVAGAEADEFLGEPLTRALLLANSDQVSRVELMSGLINAVAGTLTTIVGGQAAIIDALVDRAGGVTLGAHVDAVELTGLGVEVRYHGPDGVQRTLAADACVVACPLPNATAICQSEHRLKTLDEHLHFTKGINVAVGTTHAPDTPAFLVQLPRSEDREIAMVIVENNKSADRAPAGHGLLTISWEMGSAAAWFGRGDDEILNRSLQTAFRLFPELRGTVDYTFIRRWPLALPHTRPGVYQRIGEFTAGLDHDSRIQFAGDYMSQTGQNTAAAWGIRAADNLQRVVRI